ncbi:bulb-type lectin domain-containing protein [Astrocystis sublimbata]|nr:bulb-type lectin domain-containing protein [Astrocystis sublimbata]
MSGKNTLGNGEWLRVGESIFSSDGSTELRMQDDGKIAVYHDGECKWQNTPDETEDVHGVQMQNDGNFCLYDNSQTAIWHTDTADPAGDNTCIVAVQNDGNVVVYKGTAIWASNTMKEG